MSPIERSSIVLLAALGLGTLHAQVGVGLRGGINWAKMVEINGDGILNETHARLGPAAAIVVELPLSKRFSLLPELGFVQRGYQQEPPPYSYYSEGEVNAVMDYADMAVLAKFHIGQEPARPHLLLGATVGRMLGARQYLVDKEGNKVNGTVLDPGQLDMAQWNLGLCAGAGFTFKTGTSHVFMECRYLYGLTNIWNGLVLADLNGSEIGELNGYDRSIQFTVGWILPAGKRGNADDAHPAPAFK